MAYLVALYNEDLHVTVGLAQLLQRRIVRIIVPSLSLLDQRKLQNDNLERRLSPSRNRIRGVGLTPIKRLSPCLLPGRPSSSLLEHHSAAGSAERVDHFSILPGRRPVADHRWIFTSSNDGSEKASRFSIKAASAAPIRRSKDVTTDELVQCFLDDVLQPAILLHDPEDGPGNELVPVTVDVHPVAQ